MKLIRSQPSSDIQSEIKKRFAEFNLTSKPSKSRLYPDDLKALAREAIRQGLKPTTLCRLSGLSMTAIRTWSRADQKSKKPRRIEVIGNSHTARNSSAVIRLRSGICIELSDSASLTGDLLAMLSKVEVDNAASR